MTKIDLVNNRLIPNAIEPRAAIGDYDSGQESLTLYTTSQNPHVARLVLAAFIGLAPEHKLRVIAPDVGGGFGSKIFIYAEEVVCLWASRKVNRPVKWVAERTESFLADAHGRDHATTAELAVDGNGKILALRAKTKANLGGYLSTFASRCRPISTRRCCRASTTSPPSTARSTASTPTPRPSMPIAAPAVRGDLRRRAARGGGGAADGPGPRRVPPQELHQELPARHAGHHDLRRRRLRGLPQQGAGDGRLQGPRHPQGAERQERHEARARLLRLHRGLRHRPERGSRLARRRRRLMGVGGGARQSRPAPSRC
jgi:hypothetical protein